MSLHTWLLFFAMTCVISATPGPNMLVVMSQSARFGMRAAVATMAGCMSSLLAMMSLSAGGMGALLQAFPTVFNAMRLIGAAYLAYLGIQSFRAPVKPATADANETSAPATAGGHYRRGLFVSASNPKAILFAAAFFPQFIDTAAPKLPQFAILLLTFSCIEIMCYLIYAASGRKLAEYLRRTSVMRAFNRLTGGIFVGFAAMMAFAKD